MTISDIAGILEKSMNNIVFILLVGVLCVCVCVCVFNEDGKRILGWKPQFKQHEIV